MDRIINFICVVISSISVAAIGAGVTFYHDVGIMQNDLKHIRTNLDMMRTEYSNIVKNHENRIRELEMKLAKKIRDASKES